MMNGHGDFLEAHVPSIDDKDVEDPKDAGLVKRYVIGRRIIYTFTVQLQAIALVAL